MPYSKPPNYYLKFLSISIREVTKCIDADGDYFPI